MEDEYNKIKSSMDELIQKYEKLINRAKEELMVALDIINEADRDTKSDKYGKKFMREIRKVWLWN